LFGFSAKVIFGLQGVHEGANFDGDDS
jgi:hypothetical protein